MHSRSHDGRHAHFNSDLSGDVIFTAHLWELGQDDDGKIELAVPAELVKALVWPRIDAIVDEVLAEYEDPSMSPSEEVGCHVLRRRLEKEFCPGS